MTLSFNHKFLCPNVDLCLYQLLFWYHMTFPVDTGHVEVHIQVPQIQSCCWTKKYVSKQFDREGSHCHGLHRWVRNYREI